MLFWPRSRARAHPSRSPPTAGPSLCSCPSMRRRDASGSCRQLARPRRFRRVAARIGTGCVGEKLVTPAASAAPGAHVVLDTHTLLWLVSTPDAVSPQAREVLGAAKLHGLGVGGLGLGNRHQNPARPPRRRAFAVGVVGCHRGYVGHRSTIESADAIFAGRLPWEHRDPFDRMLVAQATRRNLTIATRDEQILRAALTPTLKV